MAPHKQSLTVDLYAIVTRAVEEGLQHAMRRVRKYRDQDIPSDLESAFLEYGEHEVMNALCEVIRF